MLDPAKMPRIDHVNVPSAFYTVLIKPHLLAGMRHPWQGIPWTNLWFAGFSDIVCLVGSDSSYDPHPLEILHRTDLEDLFTQDYPEDPEMQERLVREATKTTVRGLRSGKGIIIHCIGGTGRTGMVLGCTLKELGFAAEEVIDYLDRVNAARGRGGWPESPWQAEMIRRY
jgi:protein-tyrosine phosphatase